MAKRWMDDLMDRSAIHHRTNTKRQTSMHASTRIDADLLISESLIRKTCVSLGCERNRSARHKRHCNKM